MKTLSLLVILILSTVLDSTAQSPREEEARKELERLRKELRLPYPEPSPATQIGSRQYCAVDHGGTSQKPFRWCEYDDMASCRKATRNRSNYSCEQHGR
jgi:hypothetical protein